MKFVKSVLFLLVVALVAFLIVWPIFHPEELSEHADSSDRFFRALIYTAPLGLLYAGAACFRLIFVDEGREPFFHTVVSVTSVILFIFSLPASFCLWGLYRLAISEEIKRSTQKDHAEHSEIFARFNKTDQANSFKRGRAEGYESGWKEGYLSGARDGYSAGWKDHYHGEEPGAALHGLEDRVETCVPPEPILDK